MELLALLDGAAGWGRMGPRGRGGWSRRMQPLLQQALRGGGGGMQPGPSPACVRLRASVLGSSVAAPRARAAGGRTGAELSAYRLVLQHHQ